MAKTSISVNNYQIYSGAAGIVHGTIPAAGGRYQGVLLFANHALVAALLVMLDEILIVNP